MAPSLSREKLGYGARNLDQHDSRISRESSIHENNEGLLRRPLGSTQNFARLVGDNVISGNAGSVDQERRISLMASGSENISAPLDLAN